MQLHLLHSESVKRHSCPNKNSYKPRLFNRTSSSFIFFTNSKTETYFPIQYIITDPINSFRQKSGVKVKQSTENRCHSKDVQIHKKLQHQSIPLFWRNSSKLYSAAFFFCVFVGSFNNWCKLWRHVVHKKEDTDLREKNFVTTMTFWIVLRTQIW